MKRIILTALLVISGFVASAQSDSLSLGYELTISKVASSYSADAVSQEQLLLTDSRNALNSLFGLVPGLQVSLGGSLPWGDSPSLDIRGRGSFSGNSVLVLVDGVERDASLLNVDEIERITVLKDAASTALYGNRGADGVVLITTKRGTARETQIKASYTGGLFTPFRLPEMASGLEYASAVNEALANDGLAPRYSAADLAVLADGGNDILVCNDWRKLVLRDFGNTNEFKVSMDGAKDKVRYYIFADYNDYKGIFADTDINEGYSTQVEYYSAKVRGNIDAQLTPLTVVKFDFMGRLHQYQTPNYGTGLSDVFNTPALSFPLMHNDKYVQSDRFSNPYQNRVGLGYSTSLGGDIYADFSIVQDLKQILPGLRAEVQLSYDNASKGNDYRPFTDSYYQMNYTRTAGQITGAEFIEKGSYSGNGFGTGIDSHYFSLGTYGKISYKASFGDHSLDASLVSSYSKIRRPSNNSVSLYQDNILHVDYGFKGKYFVSATANYAGSAKLAEGDKYRLYPAVSAAWLISGEDFMKGGAFNYLKLRGSYGIVGSDRYLEYDMDQQHNSGGAGYQFQMTNSVGGNAEGALPTPDLEPERDHKANFGVEGSVAGKLSFQVDAFYNNRTNMRVGSTGAFSSVLGIGVNDICTGYASNWGGELMLGWKDKVGELGYHFDGMLSYTRSKVGYYAEPYHPYSYMYYEGSEINSYMCLNSDGFYSASDFDADGNLKPGVPASSYNDVRPGDVKYKDLNGDGIIDLYDFSYKDSVTPAFIFGFRFGMDWKNFGFEAMFDGLTDAMVYLNLSSIYQPLYNNDKNISKYAYENCWTEGKEDAKYPRLTTLSNNNNYAESDIWWAQCNYLKLRNIYLWYDLKCKAFEKAGMSNMRIFVRGNNLLSIDTIGIFDPERISLSYPSMRCFQAGIKCTF